MVTVSERVCVTTLLRGETIFCDYLPGDEPFNSSFVPFAVWDAGLEEIIGYLFGGDLRGHTAMIAVQGGIVSLGCGDLHTEPPAADLSDGLLACACVKRADSGGVADAGERLGPSAAKRNCAGRIAGGYVLRPDAKLPRDAAVFSREEAGSGQAGSGGVAAQQRRCRGGVDPGARIAGLHSGGVVQRAVGGVVRGVRGHG